MRILCVCHAGAVRSVATAWILKAYANHDAIAVGIDKQGRETMDMMCDWADLILTAEPSVADRIPERFQDKVNREFVIGEDLWGQPYAIQLQSIVNEQLEKIGIRMSLDDTETY